MPDFTFEPHAIDNEAVPVQIRFRRSSLKLSDIPRGAAAFPSFGESSRCQTSAWVSTTKNSGSAKFLDSDLGRLYFFLGEVRAFPYPAKISKAGAIVIVFCQPTQLLPKQFHLSAHTSEFRPQFLQFRNHTHIIAPQSRPSLLVARAMAA